MNANNPKNLLSRLSLTRFTVARLAVSLFTLRWNPDIDLVVVALSWILVVGGLYTTTMVVGSSLGGGLPYFFLYAIMTATIFGIGLPLSWMVLIRKRPLADLGITR